MKTSGAGGERRGFDGSKKVRGRERHVPVDAEGLVVGATVHSARVPDQDGIRRLLDPARDRLPRLSYLWADAGYRGRGKEWAEEALSVEVEVVNRSPKPPPEKVLRIWARGWFKEDKKVDLKKLPERPAFENPPRRWVAERTFAWTSHNRRMAKDHERLCSTGGAFIHLAMARLMARRLARAKHHRNGGDARAARPWRLHRGARGTRVFPKDTRLRHRAGGERPSHNRNTAPSPRYERRTQTVSFPRQGDVLPAARQRGRPRVGR